MLPRALRALRDGSRDPGVVLSSYRPCAPDSGPPAVEEPQDQDQAQHRDPAQPQDQHQAPAQHQAQAQPQASAQPQAQAQAQHQPQAQAQPQASAQHQPRAQARARALAQTQAQPQLQAHDQPQAQTQTQAQALAQPQAHDQAQAQAQPQAQPQHQPQHQPQALAQPQPQASSHPQPQPQAEALSQPQPQPQPQPHPQPQAQASAQAQPQAQPQPPSPSRQPLRAGEEREAGPGGAVFTLSPRPGQAPARLLRAAPLPRLVRHLLEAPARGDAAFGAAFLGTYRAFARPEEVLRLLLGRLEELGALSGTSNTPELTEAKAALSSLLCSWLDGYPEDFGAPQVPPLAQRLVQLLGPGSEAARRLEALGGPPPTPPAPPWVEEEEEEEEAGGDADPLEILSFQAREVAEQLTLMEAELFLRLVPYECLGALWSRRDRRGREGDCPSVRATVHQFNQLAGAVVRSCLGGGAGLRPPQRARLLEKWIHVAEECRALRNFSSLCAIVSALQSSPLHRLRLSWHHTSREAQRSYQELSALCSERDNYSASRQLLLQDPPPESPPRRQPRRPPQQRPVGVVPYLGTFLRDLVMLDAAMKDELEDGYINFEKRRKEAAVLQQVRGLQGLCRGYRLRPQPRFGRWLRRMTALPEARSHSLSCEIEPPEDPPPAALRPPKPALVITHCTEVLSSVGTPLVAWDQPSPPSVLITPPPGTPKPASRLEQKWPSVSALHEASTSPPSSSSTPPNIPSPTSGGALSPPRGHRRSASCGSTFPPKSGGGSTGAAPPSPLSDCRIIRARMDLHNGSLYKSILITSQEKTPAVVAKVLEKHGQDPASAPHFQLLQLLPDNRELLLPPSANVFYAMTATSLDFTLRPHHPGGGDTLCPPQSQPRGVEFNSPLPKIKATGWKITRGLF